MWEQCRNGARANIPLAVSAMTYGGVLGVLSGQQGVSWAEMMGMNLLLFAGSAQFVMVEMWTEPLPVVEIGLAVLVINLRYLLIGASLQPVFQGHSLLDKAMMMHLVADENWAVTMVEHRKSGTTPYFLLGGGILLLTAWSSATMVGNVLGGFIVEPERFALDFAFVAVFAALAFSLWRGKSDLFPWLVAGLVALAGESLLPGKWYIALGGICGAVVAALQAVYTKENKTGKVEQTQAAGQSEGGLVSD